MRAVIESMSKRTFELEFTGTATIELDDAVIDAVDDDWRAVFYQLHTPEDNRNARVLRGPEWEIETVERG